MGSESVTTVETCSMCLWDSKCNKIFSNRNPSKTKIASLLMSALLFLTFLGIPLCACSPKWIKKPELNHSRDELSQESKKSFELCEVGWVRLLVHVDVFARQKFLSAEKATVKKSTTAAATGIIRRKIKRVLGYCKGRRRWGRSWWGGRRRSWLDHASFVYNLMMIMMRFLRNIFVPF